MKNTKTKKTAAKKVTPKVVSKPKKTVVAGINYTKEIYFTYAIQVILAYTAFLLVIFSYYLPEVGFAALSTVIVSLLVGAFNHFTVKKDYFMTLVYILVAALLTFLLALGAI